MLTSLDEAQLRETGVDRPVLDQVVHLARLAQDSGLDGVVASPHEIAAIRARVRPGLSHRHARHPASDRPAGHGRSGAHAWDRRKPWRRARRYLVVGRPITAAADPRAAAEQWPPTSPTRLDRPAAQRSLTLTLYSKPGCHLCEEFRALLDELQPDFGFALEEIDITRDADALRALSVRDSGGADGGHEIARGRISERDLCVC